MNQVGSRSFDIANSDYWLFSDAIASNNILAVRRLVEAGCDPNATANDSKWSVLHECAKHGRLEMIEILLAAGADRKIKDCSGQTAAEVADRRGRDFHRQHHFESVESWRVSARGQTAM